ncbi:glycoside hydrolase family 16 protein [Lacibacter sediminis]|uniref:Glycoside hydrolase family 16 protein n=2 Tax=Lacibacter sediminis TaxID=2760713 RepID=A0A7G5XMH0_9BACT|nr:glycoside hydrolase family 16 protein [Lacibacter sediminis]
MRKKKNSFSANKVINEKYRLVFEDHFTDHNLNVQNWFPFYLPHWSSRKKAAPNYFIKDSNLALQITKDQQPWCPEFNGEVKCSSIQTGVYAGPLGSGIGQHGFFNPNCVVTEEQEPVQLYTPQYGYVEIRAKAIQSSNNVVSLWMIGYEDEPERSAEICVFEVKGWNVFADKAMIGYGIHQFNDPKLKEAFFEEEFRLDATTFHIYAVEWEKGRTRFYIDHQLIRELKQAPDYPMQLMLGVYEVPTELHTANEDAYPKTFLVDYVLGYMKE